MAAAEYNHVNEALRRAQTLSAIMQCVSLPDNQIELWCRPPPPRPRGGAAGPPPPLCPPPPNTPRLAPPPPKKTPPLSPRTWSCSVAPHSSQCMAEEGAHRRLIGSGGQPTHIHTTRMAGSLLGVLRAWQYNTPAVQQQYNSHQSVQAPGTVL
jgi:hypothetical protein